MKGPTMVCDKCSFNVSVIQGKVFINEVKIDLKCASGMMDCYNSTTETNQVSNPKITKMLLNFLCVAFRHHFEEIMLIIICTLLLNNKEILLKR